MGELRNTHKIFFLQRNEGNTVGYLDVVEMLKALRFFHAKTE
jgi:hypothetical protein